MLKKICAHVKVSLQLLNFAFELLYSCFFIFFSLCYTFYSSSIIIEKISARNINKLTSLFFDLSRAQFSFQLIDSIIIYYTQCLYVQNVFILRSFASRLLAQSIQLCVIAFDIVNYSDEIINQDFIFF